MTDAVLVSALLTLAAMGALWLVSLRLADASIVDIYWGPGFAVIALASFAVAGEGWQSRDGLLVLMASLWGGRLGLHLFLRARKKGAEDPRYAAMRAASPDFARESLVWVFGLQALILWFVALPVQIGIAAPQAGPPGPLALAGVALWGFGLVFEAVGDWQLMRFKADPANAGRVMDRGLWAFTRHPNYFGDACVMWGLYLVAADSGSGLYTVASPALMTYFLVRVSGARLLEEGLMRSKPDYAAYVRRTSGFIPWPPGR